MKAKWMVDLEDVRSVVRHTVVPLVAGAGVAALEAAGEGTFDLPTMILAAKTAVIAGLIRFLTRWSKQHGTPA